MSQEQPTEHMEDFEPHEWCKAIINAEKMPGSGRMPNPKWRHLVSNTLLAESLFTDKTVRAWVYRRRKVSSDLHPYEYLLMLSLGTGLEAQTGIAHGGVSLLFLDTISGQCGMNVAGGRVATVHMDALYKKALKTPTVVLCRAKPVEVTGSKVVVEAFVEDGNGDPYATAKVTLIKPKEKKL